MTRFETVGVFIWEKAWLYQTFSRTNTPYLSAYEDGAECSETSEYKLQTPGIIQKKAYNIQNTAKVM
jgi:hypothetical protein